MGKHHKKQKDPMIPIPNFIWILLGTIIGYLVAMIVFTFIITSHF